MSLHAFTEYIKYRLKAKTRHGVHSPFVYSFIENLLKDKRAMPFQHKLEAFLNNEQIIMLDAIQPGTWIDTLNDSRGTENVVIIPAIHSTALHTQCWKALLADTRVKLSIDIYEMGLLFFKDEFKEKQHFVLKYKP